MTIKRRLRRIRQSMDEPFKPVEPVEKPEKLKGMGSDYNIDNISLGRGKATWWIYAVYQGKLLIDGYYRSEQEAYSFGQRKMPSGFKVIELHTTDKVRATQELKHLMVEEIDLSFGLQRAKHKDFRR